jgi:hypothetical protein
MEQSMAKALLEAEIRRQTQTIRRDFFSLVDGLRTDDQDNVEQLREILNDENLANKFSLFQEHKSQQIRKTILDATNQIERSLLSLLENVDVTLKQDVRVEALIKR